MVAPRSKSQIGDWYEGTAPRRLWLLPKHHFTSQRFWQAMERIDDAALVRVEEDLAKQAAAEFGIALDGLIYDATNFYTAVVLRAQERAGIEVVADGELYRFDPNHPETNGMIDSSPPAWAGYPRRCSGSSTPLKSGPLKVQRPSSGSC